MAFTALDKKTEQSHKKVGEVLGFIRYDILINESSPGRRLP